MAAYTPYDLLRILIRMQRWQQEDQYLPLLTSVDEWERMGVFGNVAAQLECTHDRVSAYPPFKCPDCGRLNP